MAVDIYTDGTWEKNKGTINDVFMYGDGSHTNAAAGIVITARGENWRELGVRTITICEGGMLNADSVFPFELMAAVVAIKIAASLETHNCRIHTDCQSVQKLLTQRNLLRTLSRKENLILLQLGTIETEHIDKNWIPGHPERTVPDKAQWTKHMWGNHIADATAAGEWDREESDLYGEHTTISVRDILQAMSKEPRWMWVDSTGIPITTSIPKDIRRRRQERYLSDRDGYRAKRGAPPVWAGTRGAFAAVQYELTKVHRGELARRVRVIWDKGWHGGNIAKGKCEEEDTKCVLCGCEDGQRHWMVECGHAACSELRRLARVRMEELAEEISPARDKAYRLAKLIIEWAWSREDACRIWTGLWSPTLIQDMEVHLQLGVMTKEEVEELQAAAMSLGRIMAETALEQWSLKAHGTKGMEKKVEEFAKKVSAQKLLKRANEKKKREEKKVAEKKEALANLNGKGRVSEDMKLAFHIAKWVDKGDGDLSQAEFIEKYFDTANEIKVVSKRNENEKTVLSSNMVRGRIR